MKPLHRKFILAFEPNSVVSTKEIIDWYDKIEPSDHYRSPSEVHLKLIRPLIFERILLKICRARYRVTTTLELQALTKQALQAESKLTAKLNEARRA